MNICKPSEKRHRIHGWTFKRFRACGVLRSSVSHIKWLQGDGTFIGIQGTLFPCIQSPEAMIPAASHHKARSATTPSHHESSRSNFAAEQFEKEYRADKMDSKSATKSLSTGGGDETPGTKQACVRSTGTRCRD